MEIKAIIQVIIKCTIYLEDFHLVSNRCSSHEKVHLGCRHLDAALRPSVRRLCANLTQDSCLHFSFHFVNVSTLVWKKTTPNPTVLLRRTLACWIQGLWPNFLATSLADISSLSDCWHCVFCENSTPYLTHKAGIFEVLWWTKRCEPCDSSTSVPLHVYQARSPTCLMDFVSIVSPRDSPWPDFALHSLNLSWWCSVSPDSLLCVSFPQVLLELHSGDPFEGTSRHPADWGLICQHPQVHRNYFKRCKSPSNACVSGISGSIVQLLNARTMSGLNGIEMHIPVLKSLRCNVFATHACRLALWRILLATRSLLPTAGLLLFALFRKTVVKHVKTVHRRSRRRWQ